MSGSVFTLDDLRRVLLESAGADEDVDLDDDILDKEFADLGYESLALLETGGRIERGWNITLDDSVLADSTTPRSLIEAVNAHLTAHVA
ncbi:acyl carrier protein [Streptomyces sp. NL15-2K]|uniref:acyl carrier protein n=1 Tax=Streptomyces sp. NL15-2K TaxID=376149 RepID=UPI000F55B347|nr:MULTISPECIES: phosphopantetheine-binding protein [Actinomycetes]WKX10997.1 phosphopantetheine-binding protein [Kutzneria buriramensis]GCB46911.1 acyl carrier protein [Streptomyces sp. NL15-2K]